MFILQEFQNDQNIDRWYIIFNEKTGLFIKNCNGQTPQVETVKIKL